MHFFAKEQKVREAIEPMMPEAVGMMVPWEPPRCFFGRFPRGDIYELLFLGKGNIFKARIFFFFDFYFFSGMDIISNDVEEMERAIWYFS